MPVAENEKPKGEVVDNGTSPCSIAGRLYIIRSLFQTVVVIFILLDRIVSLFGSRRFQAGSLAGVPPFFATSILS